MTERWWYTRGGTREGPVPRERLGDLFRAGWLGPSDLVWSEGMAEWVPAGSLDWLGGGAVARSVQVLLDVARHPEGHPLDPAARARKRRLARRIADVDRIWERARPRHLVATAGGLVAALGFAFLCIAGSRLAWGLFLGGTAAALAGMHPEVRHGLVLVQRHLDRLRAEREARTTIDSRVAADTTQAPPPLPAGPRSPAAAPSPQAKGYDGGSGPVAQR